MTTISVKATEIAELTRQVVGELLDAMPQAKEAKGLDGRLIIYRHLHSEAETVARLRAAVHADPLIGSLLTSWIQRDDVGGTVRDDALLELLISSALRNQSPEAVVVEARAFAETGTCSAEQYAPVVGVAVSRPINLEENIDLLPWDDVPEGYPKKQFEGRFLDTEYSSDMFGNSFMRAVPKAAIRLRDPGRRVLYSSHEEAEIEFSNNTIMKNINKSDLILKDIVRCISVSKVVFVTTIGRWTKFDNNIADQFLGSPILSGGTLFEDAVRIASRNPPELDEQSGQSVARLFRKFCNIKFAEKNVLRIALDRINQALRWSDNVDRAIDLGIALEVMLLHEMDKKNRGELSYRTSIRGAMFLGNDKAERECVFGTLKEVYNLRSQAVHSGLLEVKKGKAAPDEKLKHGIDVCAAIARKLIDRGSFPADWEKDYIVRWRKSRLAIVLLHPPTPYTSRAARSEIYPSHTSSVTIAGSRWLGAP